MSHVVLVAPYRSISSLGQISLVEEGVRRVAERLNSDCAGGKNVTLANGLGVVTAVVPSNAALATRGASICLGQVIGSPDEWWQPQSKTPDGAFALFRVSKDYIELVTDAVSSRPVWYALTEDGFLASSSQRAMVCMMEHFEADEQSFSWVLSSATTGPGLSWSKNVTLIPPDCRVLFDRNSHEIEVDCRPIEFVPKWNTRSEAKRQLADALAETFQRCPPTDQWLMQLSSGWDSWAIAVMLRRLGHRPECVTWGVIGPHKRPNSPVQLASQLAKSLELKWRFQPIYIEPFEEAFEQFLVATEGRVASLELIGHMPFFRETWQRGFHGFIRGDEVFGWSELQGKHGADRARISAGMRLLSDFRDGEAGAETELHEQIIPMEFQRCDGESPETWRDRLYQQFRVPTLLAGWSSLWQWHLETLNPLLSRRLVHVIRGLPDTFRTDKNLFKEIVREISPDVPIRSDRGPSWTSYPECRAYQPETRAEVMDIMLSELGSSSAQRWLPDNLLRGICEGLWWRRVEAARAERATSVTFTARRIKKALARRIAAPPPVKLTIPAETLASRAFVICRMCEMLHADAKARLSPCRLA